jgi:zinc protease
MLRTTFFLLTLAACGTAFAVDPKEIPDIPYEFYKLSNGLEVILHEDHSTPIVGVNIWYHVGSKNERVGRSGFAHLFEHMMFQGSKHQDAEYFGAIQGVGGTLNGSTNEDRTNYWDLLPSDQLERALLVEADRMGWLLPAMTQEKLDNQMMVVRNERREGEGEPYGAFWLNFNENFYPKGHPYDHSVIGIHEDLEAATLDDVKDFFRTYYTPNNATLAIAGDFNHHEAKAWVEKYFSEIPPGPPVDEVEVWVPEMTQEKRVRYEDRVQLSRIYFSWHTPPMFAKGDAELSLAAKILGQGRTSRLYKRLVHEEKLAQEISAFQMSQQISSAFLIDVTLRPDVEIAQVEKVVNEEIANFARSGPTKEELQRAKNDYESGFVKNLQRIGSWGGKNDLLNRYNHYAGTPGYFRTEYESYLSPSEAGVQNAFASWIGPGRMVVEIHPFAEYAAGPAASVDRTKFPEGGEETEFTVPALQRATTSSGLEVAAMEYKELPLVRVDLVFRSGGAADPEGKSGLCDVSAGMLLEGTKKRDKFAFESALESMGTELSYSCFADGTTFSMLTMKKHLDKSLALFAEAMTEPAFNEAEFNDDKDRRLLDLAREGEDPYTLTSKVTRRVIYGADHPYANFASGTLPSVQSLKIHEARDFAKRHFTPGNATMIVVGDVELDSFVKSVEKAFARWEGAAPPPTTIAEPSPRSSRTVYLVDKPGDTQSTVSIAHTGLPRSDPDWEKLFVANHVFGGSFMSRLNLNLREDKGYSYGVRATMMQTRGAAVYSMGGRVQTDATAPSVTEFLKEFEQLTGKRPITADELARSKGAITKGYSRDFETVGQIAGALSNQMIYGLPEDHLVTYPKKIDAVDLKTAKDMARKYFHPDQVAIIVVGDLSKIEEPVRKLNLGPVVILDTEGRETAHTAQFSATR